MNFQWPSIVFGAFFVLAGLNHFVMPEFYLPLIPPFFKPASVFNVLAGIAEIALGIGFLYKKTRMAAAYGIALLMLAFIPSHVYFIQIGGCVMEGLCVPLWIAWLRLMLIQPLLIFMPLWLARRNR